MNNKEMLDAFFKAENERNWNRYQQYLHPEISWMLYGSKVKQIQGITEYLNTIKASYEHTAIQFHCEKMEISDDQHRIACFLRNDKGEKSIDIFEIKDHLIYKEFEFLL